MRSWRRLVVILAALAVGGVAVVLLLHAPIIRRAALGYAIPAVERQFGLRLAAARLDYNVAALRVGLAGVRLSAPHAADEPFFTADYLSVTLDRRSLFGELAFQDISATSARVFVRRRSDGTINLPPGSETPGGEPPPLRVGRITVPQLAIDLRDEQAVRFLSIPSIALLLTLEDGSVRLGRDAQLNTETQITHISQLNGAATFDGRALHVANLQVRSDEGSARLDGSVTLLARDPALRLRARGSIDATRLARWAVTNGDLPRGDLIVDAEIAGAFRDLSTRLSVTAERLSWQALSATELAARLRITAAGADVEALQFGFGGGRVTATGMLAFEPEANSQVRASWARVSAASATLALAPGASVAPSGSLSGQLEAQGAGTDPLQWPGTLQVNVAPGPNAPGRVAVSGDASLEWGDGNWRLDGRHLVGGVAPVVVALRGDVEGGGVDGTVRVAETDLPALVAALRSTGIAEVEAGLIVSGTMEADVRVTGSLASPEIAGEASVRDVEGAQMLAASLQATISGRPLDPSLEFHLGAPAISAAGQRLTDVRAVVRFMGTTLVLEDLSARQPSGPGLLTADGVYSFRTRRYNGSAEGAQWQLTPTVDQPIAGIVDVRLSGEGTVDAPRGAGRMTVRDAMWSGRVLGSLEASVKLDGGTAAIDASAPEFAATATGRVDLEAPYAALVDARAQGLNLSRLLQDVEMPTPITGLTTLAIHAELPLQAWRRGSAVLDVTTLDGAAGALAVRLVEPARLRYEGERVFVERLDAAAGETLISASGALPVFEAASDAPGIVVTMTGDVAEVATAVAATGLTQVPVTGGDGPVVLLARVTGALESPVIAADLEVGPGTVTLQDLPSVSDLRVRAHAEDGWVELREGTASYQNAGLSVTGKAPLGLLTGHRGPSPPGSGAADAVIHARATNLTPAVLGPFVAPGTLDDLDGSLDATLDAASPTLDLADLTGELRIDRFSARVADLPVTQRIPTRIIARDGFARVEAWDWVGQGATLTVRGQVRLEDRQTAILANGVVDLRMLTPFVREAGMATAGRLEPRLSITGALDNLRVDGDAVVTDGEIRLADPRVLVSDLAMRTVLTRATARITALTGSVNGGALTGSGSLDYRPEDGVEAQLSVDVRGMALEFPQGLRSEIDAALALVFSAGTAGPLGPSTDARGAQDAVEGRGTRPTYAGGLSGTVTVVRGTYREPLAVVTGVLAGLRARRLEAATEPSPLLDALALDVRVITDEDVIVDNNYARVQLGGDLRVIGTAASPAISGRAELREGGQLFVGRNVYTVNVGAIDFTSAVVIEPNLNVEAVTRAGGEDIEVTLTGPAENPTVTLRSTSNPSLGQAEVASLLLTGRQLEDLAPGDAAFVGTQVLGNFSAEVLGFASRAVGLDTLRLGGVEGTAVRRDPTTVATELDPTTRLTFGKSLGPNLDVTYSQSLRRGDAQTWIVEYLPRRSFELRLVSNDSDLRSYGFRHDLSFGRGPRRDQPEAVSRRPDAVRVAAVSLSGDLALPEARVRDALRLGPGDRFNFAAWQDDHDRLEGLYRAEGHLTARVTARRSEDAAGVALTYAIAAGPETRIEAAGIELNAALRSRLETAWIESVFDEFLIDEAAQIVRAGLARDGYLQAAVDVRVRDEGSAKTLVLTVDQGRRSAETRVRIEGTSEALARDLEARLTERGLLEGAVADPGGVEREVTAYLRAGGYLRARVTVGAPLVEETGAVLPVRVEPGPAMTMASIAFEGARALSRDLLDKTAALAAGMPYDLSAVEAARDRLVALHRGEGFASASVLARPTVRPEATAVDVAFVVTEGARQVLDEVVVVGNRGIDADVVVRALGLEPGAPLRAEDVLRARTRVFETGVFRRIDVATEPVESGEAGTPGPADPAERGAFVPLRLRVTVEEWPAARLRYGFVVAEERPESEIEGRDLVPGLSADVTRRTLFGRAIAVGGAVEWQRRERRGRAFLNTPTFVGLPIESSLIAEQSREQFQTATLVTSRRSVTWEQRARVAGSLSLSYAYTFERNHTFDTRTTDPGSLAFDITINIARVNAAAAWDTRDDPSDTTRGLLASSSFELAPEAVGSDIRFLRQLWQGYYFRPWRGVVFASAGRVGVAVPLGGQDLIPSERFFGGGSRTVRGVAEGGLGGRDFFGSPAGGRMMIVLNQEARVPMYRWLRGVAFADAGNVFARPGDTNLRDLVGALGVGLRLATPFALLRADYARTVRGAQEASGRWTFGIGHAF